MNKIFDRVKQLVKNEYFILSLIVLLGFVVRLYKIKNPVADWHSWRQADTASVTRNFVKNGVNLLEPSYDDISSIQSGIFNPTGIRMVEFPIYNLIHFSLFKVFGNFSLEIWGRLTTILITLLTSVFLYLLTKKHYGKKVGLLASFFFLALPFNIYFSRVILPDQLGVLFAVAGLYFWGQNFFLSAVFYALALLQKPYLGFYLLPLIPYFLKKKDLKKNIIFTVSIFTPFILWRIWTGMHPEGIPFYEWAFNGDKIRFHPSYFRWIFGERIGILILGTWGLVPYVYGLISKTKSKLNLHLNLSALFYLVAVASANVKHDYYQILIMPVVAMSLAVGSVYLWKKSKVLVVLSILVMFLVSWDRIKPFYQVNHPELMVVGQKVQEITPKNSLIIAPYMGDTAFLYQMDRKGWPAIDDSIDNLIKKGADYYVSVDLSSLDTINFQNRFETVVKTDKYIILDLRREIDL